MSLPSGRFIAAGRVLASMTQEELAVASSLHVNSVKRSERSSSRIGGYAVSRITDALLERGIDLREGLIIVAN